MVLSQYNSLSIAQQFVFKKKKSRKTVNLSLSVFSCINYISVLDSLQ